VNDLLSRVRRTPERLLHPLRRRKAVEALRARVRPKTLLVVCHGNICRSPMAAALLARELAALDVNVRSGGFIGFNRPAPAEAIGAAARYGLDLAEHRSRPVTAEVVRSADLIVVMERAQQRVVCERFGRATSDVLLLGDFDPEPVQTRTIRDPVDQDREVFEQVYERIARCVRQVVTILSSPGR
jgi:protein-tyrosine phosphatase